MTVYGIRHFFFASLAPNIAWLASIAAEVDDIYAKPEQPT